MERKILTAFAKTATTYVVVCTRPTLMPRIYPRQKKFGIGPGMRGFPNRGWGAGDWRNKVLFSLPLFFFFFFFIVAVSPRGRHLRFDGMRRSRTKICFVT